MQCRIVAFKGKIKFTMTAFFLDVAYSLWLIKFLPFAVTYCGIFQESKFLGVIHRPSFIPEKRGILRHTAVKYSR